MTHGRWSRQPRRGQALVEFALVLPIFLFLVFAVIDGARLVYTQIQLGQGAREGARVAAVEAAAMGLSDPACVASEIQITATRPGAHVCPADPVALKANVVSAVNGMAVGLGQITVVWLSCNSGDAADPSASPPVLADPAPSGAWTEASVSFPSCDNDSSGNAAPNRSGQLVSVRVEYDFMPITPIAGPILGSIHMDGSATMVIN